MEGTLPIEIGECTALTDLSLADNRLTGTIPSELGLLENLRKLDVTWNFFSGTIPQEVCDLEDSVGLIISLARRSDFVCP